MPARSRFGSIRAGGSSISACGTASHRLRCQLRDFWSDPDANPPPDGERWSDLRSRIRDAIAELESTAIVVSHAGAMRAAVSVLTGLDHRGVWAFNLPYGALLSIRVWRGEGSEPASGQIVGLRT